MRHLLSFVAVLIIITNVSSLIAHAQTSPDSTIQYYDHNLLQGMCDQKNQDLQMYLVSNGYLPGGYDRYGSSKYVTGYFGSATFKAVKKMQSANGIRITGTVGPQTRAFLNVEFTKMTIANENARQEEIRTNPNYHAYGLIPTARCIYNSLPVAPVPPITN